MRPRASLLERHPPPRRLRATRRPPQRPGERVLDGGLELARRRPPPRARVRREEEHDGPGQEQGDSTSLQRECSARARSGKSIHASRPFREMIARPKISRNEWKTAEIGAFEVGNFALLSCPDDGRRRRHVGAGQGPGVELALAVVVRPRGEQEVVAEVARARPVASLGARDVPEAPGFRSIVSRSVLEAGLGRREAPASRRRARGARARPRGP